MAPEEYALFVSHSWQYGEAYERLMGLLASAPEFPHRDVSVPKDDPIHNAPTPDQLRAALTARIGLADVVLILAGKYVNYSDWMEHEIAITKGELQKPLLAIIPRGAEQIPDLIRGACDELVAWNTDSIVSAIRKHAQKGVNDRGGAGRVASPSSHTESYDASRQDLLPGDSGQPG